ncbi:LysR family transcriptional regulator [Comamonas testosteroni KF-1]|uniref:LysR family transcriptional regulator n=1 Tax=Comamonas testosteroni (strain DSM 14576 / KF-1) TaxID=399795 RepID=B7WVV5_COMTK|nr:LysR family transcriptional regulator [Comamonas testosteroni KF-1]
MKGLEHPLNVVEEGVDVDMMLTLVGAGCGVDFEKAARIPVSQRPEWIQP